MHILNILRTDILELVSVFEELPRRLIITLPVQRSEILFSCTPFTSSFLVNVILLTTLLSSSMIWKLVQDDSLSL